MRELKKEQHVEQQENVCVEGRSIEGLVRGAEGISAQKEREIRSIGIRGVNGGQKWSELGINENVVKALVKKGYITPSEVQEKSVPLIVGGRDVLVKAWNGTGKTLSFIAPILSRINTSKSLQAIVIVPIRELALQISGAILELGDSLGIRSMPAVGRSDLSEDIMRLSYGVHLIVGTPGRIDDLLSRKLCTIEENFVLVFDEADKVLDATFYDCIRSISNKLTYSRQTLLFSATFPRSVEGFVVEHMNNPIKLCINAQKFRNVKQFYAKVTYQTKIPCLKSLLSSLKIRQCIIYCNSKHSVKYLAEKITQMGMAAYFIHSTMDCEERNIVYHNFSNGKCKILVSTDVTTRGIDVEDVNVVINFDLPDSSESYQHRIGRAGRFGRKACAINLIYENEIQLLNTYASSFASEVLPVSEASFREYYTA